jgi:hypothetical protein
LQRKNRISAPVHARLSKMLVVYGLLRKREWLNMFLPF